MQKQRAEQAPERFVEKTRVNWLIESALAHHSPRQVGHGAVSLLVEEVTPASESLTDKKAYHYNVENRQKPHLLDFSDDKAARNRADYAAVYRQAALVNIKYLYRVGEIIIPLENAEIQRTSIRFVNRFIFNEFDDPKSYFNALITSADGNSSYPLRQYGFRMLMDIPDTDIYSIVNHNVENVQDKFFYTFDIDVLDRQTLVFDIDTIRNSFEHLRSIKNTIFFDTLTEKTLQLCNSHK